MRGSFLFCGEDLIIRQTIEKKKCHTLKKENWKEFYFSILFCVCFCVCRTFFIFTYPFLYPSVVGEELPGGYEWRTSGLCARLRTTLGRCKAHSTLSKTAHADAIREQFTLQARGFQEFHYHSHDEALAIFQTNGNWKETDVILDSGCGPGIVSRYMARFVKQVVGVDITEAMLAIAKEKAGEDRKLDAKLKYVQGNMCALPFEDNSFDGSLSRYTFHHLQQPKLALHEMVRVTKRGGRIVVVDATPVPSKQKSYNAFEMQRDPSHVIALTPEELLALGHDLVAAGVISQAIHTPLRLKVDAQDLIDKAFPMECTREDLMNFLRNDVGINALDFGAFYNETTKKLEISFPKTCVQWTKL